MGRTRYKGKVWDLQWARTDDGLGLACQTNNNMIQPGAEVDEWLTQARICNKPMATPWAKDRQNDEGPYQEQEPTTKPTGNLLRERGAGGAKPRILFGVMSIIWYPVHVLVLVSQPRNKRGATKRRWWTSRLYQREKATRQRPPQWPWTDIRRRTLPGRSTNCEGRWQPTATLKDGWGEALEILVGRNVFLFGKPGRAKPCSYSAIRVGQIPDQACNNAT